MPTKPAAEPTARRARLNLSRVSVQLSETGEMLLLADDELRGPIEILLPESEARWVRASIADMGPLNDD